MLKMCSYSPNKTIIQLISGKRKLLELGNMQVSILILLKSIHQTVQLIFQPKLLLSSLVIIVAKALMEAMGTNLKTNL